MNHPSLEAARRVDFLISFGIFGIAGEHASAPHVACLTSHLTSPHLTSPLPPSGSSTVRCSPHACTPSVSRQVAAVDAALPASDAALPRTLLQGSAAPSLFPHLTSPHVACLRPSSIRIELYRMCPSPATTAASNATTGVGDGAAAAVPSLCCCRRRCRRGRRRRRRCGSITTLAHTCCHACTSSSPGHSGLAQPRSPAPAPAYSRSQLTTALPLAHR